MALQEQPGAAGVLPLHRKGKIIGTSMILCRAAGTLLQRLKLQGYNI